MFGLARSGAACIEALRLGGATVHAWDDSALAVEKAQAAGLPISNLHALDFTTIDALVLSPGVPNSMYCCASKWLRVSLVRPAAHTTASAPC